MTKVGLLFAMRREIPDVIPKPKPKSKQIEVFRVRGYDLAVLVSGVGPKKARAATKRLCYQLNPPDYLMCLGICGGNKEDLNIGDLLVADSVYCDGREISLKSPKLDELIGFLSDSSLDHCLGSFQTFDSAVLSKEGVLDGVVGVDMESYAVAYEAREHKIPLLIIKAVSDILPEKSSLFSRLRLVCNVGKNFKKTKESLNRFAQEYFENERTTTV